MKPNWSVITLDNGIRAIVLRTHAPIAHLSFMVAAGSRDESEEEHGTAHFIEHMLFKGTRKRKAYHILSRLDDVGGDLNAYTTKEETCIHASFLNKHLSRAADLISDIAFEATFPVKEIEKEREVILDEIASYQDTPSELLFEEFEDLIFPNHPLGRTILGTKKSVKEITHSQMKNFLLKNYSANGMVVALAGDFTEKRSLKILNHFFGQAKLPSNLKEKLPVQEAKAKSMVVEKQVHQAHAIIGAKAIPASHPMSLSFSLTNNILGGPAMNNRLNLNIREKYGFTYNLESFYHPFSDTGIFGVYLGTDPKSLDKSLHLVHKELDKLIQKPLGPLQLHKAKSQILGQIALGIENKLSLILNLSKALLFDEPMEGFDRLQKRIEKVSHQEIQAAAAEIFPREKRASLIFKPN